MSIDFVSPRKYGIDKYLTRTGRKAAYNPNTGAVVFNRNGKIFEYSLKKDPEVVPLPPINTNVNLHSAYTYTGLNGVGASAAAAWTDARNDTFASLTSVGIDSRVTAYGPDRVGIYQCYLYRSWVAFDTAFLAGRTITLATVTFNTSSILNNLTPAGSIRLCKFSGDVLTPDSNDWDDFDFTECATTIALASAAPSCVFTLNATGLAYINTAGLTAFGLIIDSDAANSAPTFTPKVSPPETDADHTSKFSAASGATDVIFHVEAT